jgi:predicted extracellular nuclease
MRKLLALGTLLAAASAASANIRITEFMYSGTGPEYVELTNIGASAVDLTGWSYDDVSGVPDSVSLSDFGVVAAGESVIFTEGTAAQFILDWSLPASVKVLGGNTQNLGRADTINIYNASDVLVDQLNFGDQAFPGTIRAQNASGWAIVSGPGPYGNIDAGWVLSAVGDSQGSYANANADVGSPGMYAVPEPATLGLIGGLAAVALRRRR